MKTKPTIFLLPGLLCDKTVWVEQVKALQGFAEVIVPSFRGLDSLSAMAEAVLAQAPDNFSVVGHSMGGRVALELVHMAAARIEKLVLMDTGIHPANSTEQVKRQPLLDLSNSEGMAAVAQQWATPMVGIGGQKNKALMASIFAMVESYSAADYKGQIQALLSRQDRTSCLSAIQQEVLLVCGEEDRWSPVAQHQEMLKLLPHGKLKVVAQSGHMVTMEQPQAVNQILLDWLSC